jgi:Ulp1 family protease
MNVHESKVVPLIFFIYIGASHWVCTAHIVPSKDIEVMDSIGANELTDTTLLQIATVYKTNTQLLRMKYSAVQLQKGAHDCGLFSIANAAQNSRALALLHVYWHRHLLKTHKNTSKN